MARSRTAPFGMAALLALVVFAVPALAREVPTATVALSELPVKGRAPKTGYSRAEFGQAWHDEDHNGCDTRNDVLHGALTVSAMKPGRHSCVVLAGSLVDPYSGRTLAFERGPRSAEVQIDHVVALSNAWQTGAFRLSAGVRRTMANDPLNLLAVDGRLNSQKGDGDAATWLPPLKSFRCAYVARQVAVKRRYGLWVTPPEKAAIARILAACPNQRLPTK